MFFKILRCYTNMDNRGKKITHQDLTTPLAYKAVFSIIICNQLEVTSYLNNISCIVVMLLFLVYITCRKLPGEARNEVHGFVLFFPNRELLSLKPIKTISGCEEGNPKLEFELLHCCIEAKFMLPTKQSKRTTSRQQQTPRTTTKRHVTNP